MAPILHAKIYNLRQKIYISHPNNKDTEAFLYALDLEKIP